MALVAAGHAAPVIFHNSETASPGDIIGVQGDGFGTAPEVWLQRIQGSEPSLSPQVRLTVLNHNAHYVSAQIPDSEAFGLYAIWVKDGTTLSAPGFVNRARAWGAGDLAGLEIDPGRTFRLWGANLHIGGAAPAVRLVSGSTSLDATVTTAGSDPYALKVTAPAGLAPGVAYDIYVRNGHGSAYGETKADFQLTGRAGGADPMGIGVPWGADVTFAGNVYNVKSDPRLATHAVGDGVANDRAAIQAAIDAANADGGGVVYLPAGNYLIDTPSGAGLSVRARVVLKGDGRDSGGNWLSKLRFIGTGDPFVSIVSGPLVGFVGLEIGNHAPAGGNTLKGSPGKLFVVNSRVYTLHGWGVASASQKLVFKDSEIYSEHDGAAAWPVQFSGASDVMMTGNRIYHRNGRLVAARFVHRCQFENNIEEVDVLRTSRQQEYGGLEGDNGQRVVCLNNTFTNVGQGKVPQVNDGETILLQYTGAAGAARGSVTSATATTLTDISKNWTFNYATATQPDTYYAIIIAGPGTGQIRRIISNTTTTLTLAEPWDVVPTTASRYAVSVIARHWLIKGNIFERRPRGIWLFSASMEDVKIVDNTLTDNEGIWLRADDRPVENYQRITITANCSVINNTVSDTLGWAPAYIGNTVHQVLSDTGFGTLQWGLDYRGNTVTALSPNLPTGTGGLVGEGYWSYPAYDSGSYTASRDGITMASLGTIFQDNTAVNTDHAFRLSTGDYDTVIWDTNTQNVANLISDQTGTGTTHGAIGTVVGPGGPPLSAPPAPSGLNTSASSGSQVDLFWTASSGGVMYNVKRAMVSGGPYTTVATGVTGVGYSDTGLSANTQYVYVVSAVHSGVESANSGEVSVTTLAGGEAPPTPADVQAVTANQRVILSWTPSAGATSYRVKRAGLSGGPYPILATGLTGTTFVDDGLPNGTTYYYVVTAVSGAESAASAEVAATPQASITLIKDNRDTTGVTIVGTWTASASASGYYGTNYLHDGNTGAVGGKRVEYVPTITTPGSYDVYGRWTASSSRANNVPMDVVHAAGSTTVIANQRLDNGAWVKIGTFPFVAGAAGSVTIRNDGTNGFVVADAVQFAFAGTTPAITTSPEAQSVTVGDSIAFTVAATGSALLSYQWRKDGLPLAGNDSAATSALTIDSVTTADAGSYECVVTNYLGSATSASAALTVAPASASVSLGALSFAYDGTPHPTTATTSPDGLDVSISYGGSSTAPVDAGSYAVVATINHPDYVGSASGTLVISPAAASISLSELAHLYDGQPKHAVATTVPAGLPVAFTYGGSANAPVLPGAHDVVASVNHRNYAGTATGTLTIGITALVRHAPGINGGLDGSLQVLQPESVNLNSSSWVAGDLLIRGMPQVVVNGQSSYAGTLDGSGAASPGGHTVTLNSGVLRHVVRRVDAIELAPVGLPPSPTGTRDVALNAGQGPGDFTTLRSLTLNQGAGQVAVPPGTYGAFVANSGTGFVLGVAGAPAPAVYNLQSLTLNGGAQLQVAGPVVLTVADDVTISGAMGASTHPKWLELRIARGDLTLNGTAALHGTVVAPAGLVSLNADSTLHGQTASDGLTINSDAVLTQPEP